MTMIYEKLIRQPRELEQPAPRRPKWLRNAIAMQEIEGNPLAAEEIATFDDFEARGLSHEQRRAEINKIMSEKYGVPQLFK